MLTESACLACPITNRPAIFYCDHLAFSSTSEVMIVDFKVLNEFMWQLKTNLARCTGFIPFWFIMEWVWRETGMLGGRERGNGGWVSRACRSVGQWWKNRIRERWRDVKEREHVGHLSSGESTVWPGRESGPLAGTTHEHGHVCHTQTHAHIHICALTQW